MQKINATVTVNFQDATPEYETIHDFGVDGNWTYCVYCGISRNEAYAFFRTHGENLWCKRSMMMVPSVRIENGKMIIAINKVAQMNALNRMKMK